MFKRGRLWHAKFKLDSWPTERRESLGTTDSRVARHEMEKRLTDFELVAAGKLAPRQARDAAQQPLPVICAAFLADIGESISAGTLKRYGQALRCVCVVTGWTRLEQVTETALLKWQRESKLRASTRNDYLNVWRLLFKTLKRQRLILEDPCEYIRPVDEHKTAREYRGALLPAQVQRLLEVAPEPRRTIYRFMLETALRGGELRGLRVGDFNFGAASYSRPEGVAEPALADRPRSEDVGGSITRGSFGGTSVRVPASIAKGRKSSLMAIQADTAADLRAIIPTTRAAFDFALRGLVPKCSTFYKDLAAAGIPPVDAMQRRIDLHCLRKSAGVALVLSGALPRVCMEFMRHSDLKLTMVLYMDAAQLVGPVSAAVARLPWHRDGETSRLEKA